MNSEALRREFEEWFKDYYVKTGFITSKEETFAIYAAGRAAAGKDDWRAMLYAPMDGTEIELLVHHKNYQYAEERHKENWEQIVRAKWIDFNGGGWTWQGMSGQPIGWRAIDAAKGRSGT